MALDNEQVVRQAYKIAREQRPRGMGRGPSRTTAHSPDESIGVTYRGPDGLPVQVEN